MTEFFLDQLELFCTQQMRTFAKKQLILLEGDLGAGKTTLVQTCVRLLGHSQAESPTFSIINEYPTSPKVFHVDLYRLQTAEDIVSTGFWDLFLEESAYIFVEWSDRVMDIHWSQKWSPVKWSISPVALEPLKRKITVSKIDTI